MSELFQRMPYPLKVILVSGQSLIYARKRYSGDYKFWLERYKRLWYASADEIRAYQQEMLLKLLKECVTYSSWYRGVANQHGITLDEITKDPFGSLMRFPILTKEERRTAYEAIMNQAPGRDIIHRAHTSGTTGSPTVNLTDKESINAGFGLWGRFHHVIGLPRNRVRSIRFSGKIFVKPSARKPPFWVYNATEQQLLVSSYHLAEEYLGTIVNKINEFKPVFMDGYPSSMFVIADFIKRNNIKLSFTPTAIATTAETLYDYHRQVIEEVFGCHVYNQYASSEGGPFITECREGNLHLNIDSGIFEFFRPDGSIAGPGDVAELVVTSLRTFKLPLIRYAIKDVVELLPTELMCSCGCNMPMVKQVVGREDDILWTPDRGYIGRMDTAYKGLAHIVKSQVVQHSPELVEIISVVDAAYSKEMEDKFLQNLRERMGQVITVKFTYVDDIPNGKAGKFDAVVRKFPLPNTKQA